MGSAYSDLISLSVYNFIRFEFLRRKFGMQPFTIKTLHALLLAAVAYCVPYFLFQHQFGWIPILMRSFIFSLIIISGVYIFKLTPDAMELYNNAKKRLGF